MENARLLTETREALEQQTATAEVLQVINASPGNLEPVFAAILNRAHTICGAEMGSLQIWDGTHIGAVATLGYPEAIDAVLRQPTPPGRGQLALIAANGVSHRHDVTVEPALDERALEFRRLTGVRTNLLVPLRKDGACLGFVTANRREVRPFTDKEIRLLQNFAAQAVIAMENARLLTELRERTDELARRNSEYSERIDQQTATINVLEAMSASSGDAQPVFQVIVERARAFCNADNANLALVDGNMLHVQATTIGSGATAMAAAERADYMARFPRPVDATSLFGRAVLTRTAVQAPDVRSDPQHFTRLDTGETTVRALVAVPLLRTGAAVGAIVLARNTPGEFSATQVELLQTFAEQAVIAMSSSETFKELQRRTADLTRSVAELQALEEVLRAVNSSLELETVLSTIISRAVELSDADEGTIYEFDDAEQVFVPKSAYGMTGARLAALRDRRIRIGETPLGNSAAARAPVHIPDLTQTLHIHGARMLVEDGIHALLAVPLLRDQKVLGGLVIRRRAVGGFAPSVQTLLQTFAGQCVLAIENARLFQEARQARVEAEFALSDLRRAQDRLVQSEKMASLGQLTAGIAHEIKNPLNFVNNFASLSVDLLDELKQTAAPGLATLDEARRAEVDELANTLASNLDKINEHGRRADGIVRGMLEHSRGSSGERREVDLNALVDEALNLAYHGARAQDQSFNVTLQREFREGIAPITLAPQDVTRVLLNLLSNGFYAARERQRTDATPGFEPTVKVSTRDLDGAVEIRVRDNGIGIPAEIRDRLFQPFFTTKPPGEGTGLGLSMSYDIITQQHGGSISVDSKVGEYSEFTVWLPRRP
jgi:two-component system NtrC family sensor kinase